MLFNSVEFLVFLPAVFFLYWALQKHSLRIQNLFLIVASYFFYGWWDWRFLSLIVISSLVDYLVGIRLGVTKAPGKRKTLLVISLMVNLGFLGVFKYFNFFAENLVQAFTFMGSPIEMSRLNIILPVGISFYTFQTLSYSIDVYRGKLEPTRDPVAFFAFVSFFPQLVAGPIERATNLLPQFSRPRVFSEASSVDGLRQILWGLFKKVVIADNCAEIANATFATPGEYSGSALALGAMFFTFQIYGDFSGYSDIAIGTARLFGFNLMRNFAFPYFSRDIAEFWRRWHISLSTWFRDYLYIPLGGSVGGTGRRIRNTFIIFAVSGFWHGANWTFISWGVLNALYFLPLLLTQKNRRFTHGVAEGRRLPGLKEGLQILSTFTMTVFAWIIFRAGSLAQAGEILARIFSQSLFSPPALKVGMAVDSLGGLILLLVVVEWIQRDRQHGLDLNGRKLPAYLRWGIYYSIIILIIKFQGVQQEFIYFQF